MNYVREYWERISSGEIVTSRRVKAVYGRLVAEMDAADENSPYYFDEAVGERPIIFVERFCKQSQGTLGESLTLELFQKAFIQLLFGWLERATGYRRFRETLFLVGRKNGKSTLLAALALYMLVADYEGAAEIYSVATKKDQAKKTLTEAVNMVKQSPELSAILKKRRNDIYFPATASKFEALASDSNTLDGLNSHAVIIDELHAIRDRNLYEVMKQSTSSRRQPLVIMITTSGTVRESVFDMFTLRDDFGGTQLALEAIEQDTRESFAATCAIAAVLAERGELLRRRLGYDPGAIPEKDDFLLMVRPFEIVTLKRAIMTAIELGYGREVTSPADDEIDEGLAELNQKKTR